MSTLKVNAIRQTAASSDAVTLASDGTCTAKITNNLSNRNLIINGAMQVAQRGTTATSDGYKTVDRFQILYTNTDEAPTQSQVDVAAGTTPYTLGFRKAYRITNGNQTGGLGAADVIRADTKLEAQDFANSGWNYKSASSYITLSYWVKSSVAQEFFGYFYTSDSPSYRYGWSLGSLSADTWTKITKTIPGNSNLVFDNNNDIGCWLNLFGIWGTDGTASDAPMNTWAAWDTAKRTPDQASTWYTTNDATFDITGVQLEVGDVATVFEHRSYSDELQRCKRYYNAFGIPGTGTGTGAGYMLLSGGYAKFGGATSLAFNRVFYDVEMRATPTIKYGRNTDNDDMVIMRWSDLGSNPTLTLNSSEGANNNGFHPTLYNSTGGQTYDEGKWFIHSFTKFRADAEI